MKEAAAAQGRVSCRGNAETSSECIIGGRTDDLSQIDETGIEMGLQCKYGITVYIHMYFPERGVFIHLAPHTLIQFKILRGNLLPWSTGPCSL